MKKSLIRRPTEEVALSKWEKSHCSTKPTFFPHIEDRVERLGFLNKYGGCIVVIFPVLLDSFTDLMIAIPPNDGLVAKTSIDLNKMSSLIECLKKLNTTFEVYIV